jgi:hypothetical protein
MRVHRATTLVPRLSGHLLLLALSGALAAFSFSKNPKHCGSLKGIALRQIEPVA